MRILYSHRIQSRDGQSVHVEELVAALRDAGHEVMVVGPTYYAASSFGGESRVVARLRRLLPGALGEIAELAYNIPAYLALRRAAIAAVVLAAGGWLAAAIWAPVHDHDLAQAAWAQSVSETWNME